ncbi:MAG TPA: MerR family transcriptional regulator [Gemmatimonadales bacterium]|nr:MerR family transcriptional regulator [Gemmatimonadales bacterium]
MTESDRSYEIQEVAELTGLTTARLRAWERRYAVVRPERQANGYRAYTAAQVALLRAFARLVGEGERIGDLAAEPREAVIARAEATDESGVPLAAMLDAVRRYDRDRLQALVEDALARLGLRRFADEVVLPLATQVGDLWSLGRLPIASEHLASEIVVHTLKGSLRDMPGDAPLLLAAALPGERHEWGLLATLAAAHADGWRVQYLGADLPLDELIQAAWTLRPAAVALSSSDPDLVERNLPGLYRFVPRLPPGVRAIIGGRGAAPAGNNLLRHGFQLELGRPAPSVRQ